MQRRTLLQLVILVQDSVSIRELAWFLFIVILHSQTVRAIGAELLLLGQVHAGGFGSDGNAVFVQGCDQHLTRVLVIGVKVKHIPHHVGQALVWKFLKKKKERCKSKAFRCNDTILRALWSCHQSLPLKHQKIEIDQIYVQIISFEKCEFKLNRPQLAGCYNSKESLAEKKDTKFG